MANLSERTLGILSLQERHMAGPALLLLAVAAGLGVFSFGLAGLVDAWSLPEYSHGPIIPLISTFLFLREMRLVPPTTRPVTDRWPGVGVMMLGLVVGVLGNEAQITHVVTYGFIVWVAGLILVTFGLRRGLLFWPAVLHLVFMLPLPQFIYWQVSTYLQTVSSEIGVAVIQLFNVPVFLDGNIIDLGVYKLQVAEACSGLRYLFPMLSFSYVFALLYQGPMWHRAVLLLAAAPITVLMNSFRIGVIGIMVDNFGISYAEGFLHLFEGWIIFVSCVLLLFGMAIAMQRTTASPKPLSETLDISFDGLRDEARRFFDVMPSSALIAGAVVTAVMAGLVLMPADREIVRADREPLILFPESVGDWNTYNSGLLDPLIEQVLGADDYLSARMVSSAGGSDVDLFVAFYHNQMDGTGIHSPEVCIPSGGWEVSGWRSITVNIDGYPPVSVNRAIIQKGTLRQLVYFWFDLRGQRVSGEFNAKWVNLRDSVVEGRSDGALVRLITPLGADDIEDDADESLQTFMKELLPILPRFVPH
jgi:exosortase D (VPLPA-CTERM-specific)